MLAIFSATKVISFKSFDYKCPSYAALSAGLEESSSATWQNLSASKAYRNNGSGDTTTPGWLTALTADAMLLEGLKDLGFLQHWFLSCGHGDPVEKWPDDHLLMITWSLLISRHVSNLKWTQKGQRTDSPQPQPLKCHLWMKVVHSPSSLRVREKRLGDGPPQRVETRFSTAVCGLQWFQFGPQWSMNS